jgi:hypothetical protein
VTSPRALAHSVALLLLAACAATPPATTPAPAPPAPAPASAPASATPPSSTFTPDEQRASSLITAASISAPIRYLADDLLEGRAPASRGDALAMKYVAAEFESFGLEPGATGDGPASYFQKVPLVELVAKMPSHVQATTPRGPLSFAVPEDLVVAPGAQEPKVALAPTDVVFVGYGIVAPEYQWDDYKDVDVRGKIVVVMNNDPEDDPQLFAGKTRLWYGRWDYKYLQAAQKGAAGAVIIHTTHSAGYPWQVVTSSFGHTSFELPADPNERRLLAKMWIAEPAAKKLAAAAGEDLDALRKSAESRDFRPRALGGVKMGLSLTVDLRRTETDNVLGLLRGADPAKAGEVVVFSAHHDHLGIRTPVKGDAIYNGAQDNASGVAALVSIARAFASSPRPRRSILFAAVAAEEQGLLGSEWYCRHPTFPVDKIAADLNMDSLNVHGRTNDVGFPGLGKSSLDDVVAEVARAQGRTLHGDAFPDRGSYYRSDQFSFAKVGVPGVYVRGGPSYVGKPASYGVEVVEAYERTHYHQPSDELDPSWDLSGAVEDAQLLFVTGERVANSDALPAWKPGDEFAKRRAAKP